MDISDAFDWYNAESPDLGDAFIEAVNQALFRIAEYPEAAPIIFEGRVRRLVMETFPYCAYYIPDRSQWRVIAMMHQRRDPRDWRFASNDRAVFAGAWDTSRRIVRGVHF